MGEAGNGVPLTRAMLRTQLDKCDRSLAALLEEVRGLRLMLDGEATPGQEAQGLVKDFAAAWNGKYAGQAYVPNWAKDVALVKRVLKTLDPAEVRLRIARYLASTDTFYSEARHPIGLFVAAVNKFAQPADSPGLVAVGCQHDPKCKTDAAHTAKLLKARRS